MRKTLVLILLCVFSFSGYAQKITKLYKYYNSQEYVKCIEMCNTALKKKPEMLEKIVDGQIKKWAAEICLQDQKFVKNTDVTIAQYLKETIAKIGENIVIRRFVRYELGEGIEKRKDNFAEEVAQQLKG